VNDKCHAHVQNKRKALSAGIVLFSREIMCTNMFKAAAAAQRPIAADEQDVCLLMGKSPSRQYPCHMVQDKLDLCHNALAVCFLSSTALTFRPRLPTAGEPQK